jgi:hypothetical protein
MRVAMLSSLGGSDTMMSLGFRCVRRCNETRNAVAGGCRCSRNVRGRGADTASLAA